MQFSDFIGKILFPQQRYSERRQNVKLLLTATSLILIALLFGLVLIRKEIGHNKLNPEPQSVVQSPVQF